MHVLGSEIFYMYTVHVTTFINGFTVHCVEFFNQFYLQILSYLYMYLVLLNMEAVIVFV